MSVTSSILSAQTALDAAMAQGDNAAALVAARRLMAALVATPDTQGEKSGLTWDRAALRQLIVDLQQQVAATANRTTGGVRRTKIRYVNPTSDGGAC